MSKKVRENGTDLFGRGHGLESFKHRAISSYEELGEIPRDGRVTVLFRDGRGQATVQLASVVTVDLDLREHWKIDVVVGGRELGDFGIGTGFLRPELITRKSENVKTLCAERFLKRTQTCVLRREASFTRDVNDEAEAAVVMRKLDAFTGDRIH